jgi:nitrogen fixation/metabolism regulation signal transduction histidine kinase
VFLGFFSIALAYRVLNPLPQLIHSLKKLTGGDFDQNIKVKSSDKDEIGQLAREFNRMLSALKERDHKIKVQQRELLQSERLAAIGQLSAEVVHEIRNPLNSINLNIDWLETEIQDGNPEIKKTLKSVSREIERLTQITESYLVRARVKTQENNVTEVNELLREIIQFERGDKCGIEIESELFEKEIYVKTDRSKIKQAFLTQGNAPTILNPTSYKERFKKAMATYFISILEDKPCETFDVIIKR